MRLSVLLPAYNEADNLPEVVAEIVAELDELGHDYEVVVVNDGSTDETESVLREMLGQQPALCVVTLRRNFGKSKALATGFAACTGEIIILMDADGQDDPSEIGTLLGGIDQGFDLVTGRRSIRNDRFVKRNTSKLYNSMTSRVSGVEGSDFNSGFKVMRRSVSEEINLYGELHRYIPVLADWLGFKTTEIDVNHRERLHGGSKFGRSRFWRGMLDLITVKFLTTYDRRPFHIIGGVGLTCLGIGGLLLTWMLTLRILGEAVGDRPALLAGMLFALAGLQLVTVGLLAEMVVSRGPSTDPGRAVRSTMRAPGPADADDRG